MKKNFIVLLIALFTLAILFTSCDSLWNVGERTNVSFNLNLDSYLQRSNISTLSDASRSVVPGGNEIFDEGGDDGYRVVVSLHDSYSEEVLASETLSYREAQNANVTFNHVRVGQKVYAQIMIIQNDDEDGLSEEADPNASKLPFVFRASSPDTTLKGNLNVLKAKPNALFYYGNGVSNVLNSDDVFFGNFYKIEDLLQNCYDYMSVDGKIVHDATVYVRDPIRLSYDDETWNFPGLTLMRDTNYDMINVIGVTLSLSNIILDGNKENYPDGFSGLILVDNNGILNILGGTSIQNCDADASAILVNPGILNMKGGTITGNKGGNSAGALTFYKDSTFTMTGGSIVGNSSDGDYGGVYTNGGTFNLSGNPIIKGNTNTYGQASNVYLEEGTSITIIDGGSLTGSPNSIGISVASGYLTAFAAKGREAFSSNEASVFFSDSDDFKIVNYGVTGLKLE